MPLIPALGRKRQVDLSEFEASLVCKVSSKTAKATQRNPILKIPLLFEGCFHCFHFLTIKHNL